MPTLVPTTTQATRRLGPGRRLPVVANRPDVVPADVVDEAVGARVGLWRKLRDFLGRWNRALLARIHGAG
jgi:hypothetical protein